MTKKPYQIFEEIVDGIRATGTITNFYENGNGKYTVVADNSFTQNDFIKITNNNDETFEDVQIFEADSVSFVIETNIGYDDQYSYAYKANAPYYMHEEELKAANRLIQKTGELKWQKYPLVLLFHPYKENYPKKADYPIVPDIKIGIINLATGINEEGDKNSAQEKNSDQRYADNFVPILDPIFESVIEGIFEHADVPVFSKTDMDYSNMDKFLLNGNPLSDLLDGKLFEISDFPISECRRQGIIELDVDLEIEAEENGTAVYQGNVITDPEVFTVPKNSNQAIFADADPGFKFLEFLVNGSKRIDNPVSILMESDRRVIVKFTESLIKQLQIAYSGTGRTDPVAGNYDREQDSFQLIEAFDDVDSNYIFDEFKQDGNSLVGNPVNVEITDNTLVVAYFIVKWLQWVFNNAVQKIANLTYFVDRSPNANNVQVKDIPCGLFNGSVYILYDMTGRTIASYESDGSAVPTKTDDTRIDVTAGELYSITRDDGHKCYLNERKLDKVYWTDGTYATVENVVLDNFRIESDNAVSGIHLEGYSKDLVCTSAGTTATLGATDGSNLGVEKIVNGEFLTDADWVKVGESEINNGSGRVYTSAGSNSFLEQIYSTNIGACYLVEFDIISNDGIGPIITQESSSGATIVGSTSEVKHYSTYYKASGSGIRFKRAGVVLTDIRIDNVSVKEVTPISLLDIYKFKLDVTNVCETYYLDSADITSGDGYMVKITPTAITLYRVDAGSQVLLQTKAIVYNGEFVEVEFHGAGITVDVGGTEELSSNDATYPTFKFTVLNNSVGDGYGYSSKGGLPYDIAEYNNQTGVYEVVQKIGDDTPEIPANVVSNSGNTYDGVEGLADGATYEDIYDAVFDEETKTAYKEMGYITEIKVL